MVKFSQLITIGKPDTMGVEQMNPLIYVLSGLTFCMGFFSLIAFFYNKRQEFLYYTVYLILTTVYFFYFPVYLGDGISGYENSTQVSSRDMTEVSINIFYTLFVVFYIDLKNNLKKAYRYSIAIIAFHILLAIYYVLSLKFYNNQIIEILRLVRVFAFSLAYTILMLYIIVKVRNRFVYITLLGSFFLTIGAILFRVTGNSSYLIVFMCIELIVFGLGLLYKVRLIDIERNQIRIEAEINKRKALRAQINPHFIFNALGSIQGFITQNNRVSALKYLSKFARLTRNILESSIETNVVLKDEIKMLEDYLDLESLRFENAFDYHIHVDEDIDIDNVEIPFMILQPFVENAIVHGLLPKKEESRKLEVNFHKKDKAIICEIDDNGVGRQHKEKSQYSKSKKKSRGLEITKQRLENLGLSDEPLKIVDKLDSEQRPLGTKVIVKVPA